MNPSNAFTKLPLITVDVTLKFSRPHFMNRLGEVVITSAFEGFKPDPNTDFKAGVEKMKATGLYNQIVILKDVPIRRRFAGDFSLTRARYYSVCNDEFGNDKGTVTRELLGYYEGNAGNLVVHDFVMPEDKEYLHRQLPNAPAGYVIRLLSTLDRPSPITTKLINEGLISTINGEVPEKFDIYMPLDLKTETIENVFDLRQLKTQQWLANFLPKGDKNFKKNADPISSFIELLPDLTVWDRGGSDFTDNLGIYLRCNGANGMIFPSARCNVGCEFLNGELNDFKGFNFVDYRGLEAPVRDIVMDVNPWTDKVFEGVTFHAAPADSPYAHSWRIEGKEAAEDSNRERWMNKFYE